MTTITDALAAGWEQEQSGEWGKAEAIYRRVIADDARCIDGWFRLGLTCIAQQRFPEAVRCLRQAVELKPDFAEAWSNLGVGLASQCLRGDAEAAFRRAVALEPNRAELQRNLGNVLRELGRFDEAASCFRASLELDAASATAYYGLALVSFAQERLDEAIENILSALAQEPQHPQALSMLSYLTAELETAMNAAKTAENTDRSASLLADLQNGYGVLLAGGNRLVEAVQAFRKALTAYPESEEGHANLCNALIELGRDEEARHALQTAIRLHPWNAGNHLNLGYLHARAGRLDEAVRCYRRALRCKPDYVEAHNNLGIVYDRQRRFEEAIECFRNAIRFNPNYEGAHYNLGLMYLRQGDWEQGWPEYEWRLRFKDRAARSLSHPQWDGSPLKGKTILLRTEQGLGDTIQFVRYAVEVKNRGGHVIVECPATLIPLLSTCRGIDQFIATGAERPDFDVHAMMMSLPAILKTSLSTVPCDVPYLAAEPERMRIWEQELAKDGNGFRVGIAWRGSPTFKRDRQRSIPLSAFEPIARLEGVQLYSLQKGCVEAELAAVCDDFRVVDLGTCLDNQCGAFLDTAAVMMHLDLIVSIDSAPAHLAGALGVPVWVALPYAADWRWLADCDESPWYPSMRLFRQSEPGKWGDVFERMAAELAWRRSRADERAVQGTCETSGSD